MLTRRRLLQRCLATITAPLITVPITSCAARREAPSSRQVWGYYPAWLGDAWRTMRLAPWDRVILFELKAEQDGTVALPPDRGATWQDLGSTVRASGGQFDVAITVLDEAHFAHHFGDSGARERLLNSVLALTDLPGVGGLHLDVEVYQGMPAALLKAYREWVAILARQLARSNAGTNLTAFIPMGGQVALYDAPTLALFDYLILQGYDAHSAASTHSGPVAPLRGGHVLSWENTLAQMLAVGIPRAKMLFSLPYFGYEWPVESEHPGARATGPGIEITYAAVDAARLPLIRTNAQSRVHEHGLRRDPRTGSPYYVFRNASGTWRQGWFEDEQSLTDKLRFLHREGLAGAAIFPIGYDAGQFDALLQSWSKP